MATWGWIVVVVAVLVIAGVITLLERRRRTAVLRDRFGDEYDRAVESRGGPRAAETELRERQRRRAELDIKPLTAASRIRYAGEWRVVQEHFVDRPAEAVGSADGLLHQVMAERGYPISDFAAQSDLISVDHPQVVENYRTAHAIHERVDTGPVSTEELRDAMLRYRSLFDEMLRADQGEAAAADATPGRTAVASEDAVGSVDTGAAADMPDSTDSVDSMDDRAAAVPARHTAGQAPIASEADDDIR
jgi:hypothetical protein